MNEVVSSSGARLDHSSRALFESRLAHDFGPVRVHTDAKAAASARAVNALAYSVGPHVVFAPGQFQPGTWSGQQLLAHELAHVVQHGMTDAGANVYRHPPPTGGGPPRRIIYIDANVFDHINRGNQAAATALLNLRNSGADLRISNWTYREMVEQPEIPRTAAANRLLIRNLAITVDSQVSFPQRVEFAEPNQLARGLTVLSPRDAQVVVGARAGGGEIWSFDRAFRNAPQNIQTTFGVPVAAESHLPAPAALPQADYRIGRRALGLPAVDITLSGVVRLPRPPGGGGGRGGGPPRGGAPPALPPAGARAETPPATERAVSPTAIARRPPVQITVPAPRVPVPASQALIIEQTRLITTLGQQTARSAAFATRLQTYVRVAGQLLTLLDMINAAGDILEISNEGTILPDAQRAADRVSAQSSEAQTRAQETYDSISLMTATVQVGDAISRGDSTALFDLSSSLGDFGLEVSEQAFRYGELAASLHGRSRALHQASEMYARMVELPQGHSTAPQAHALAIHLSLQRLSGTLGRAADNYDVARARLGFLGDFTLGLATRANRTAWSEVFSDIARRLAEMERQRAAVAAAEAVLAPPAAAPPAPR